VTGFPAASWLRAASSRPHRRSIWIGARTTTSSPSQVSARPHSSWTQHHAPGGTGAGMAVGGGFAAAGAGAMWVAVPAGGGGAGTGDGGLETTGGGAHGSGCAAHGTTASPHTTPYPCRYRLWRRCLAWK